MDFDSVSVHKHAKTNESLNKGPGFTTEKEHHDSAILLPQVTNHGTGFSSSCLQLAIIVFQFGEVTATKQPSVTANIIEQIDPMETDQESCTEVQRQ